MTDNLSSLILGFVFDTCLGQERGVYKAIHGGAFSGLSVDDLKKEEPIGSILTGATADYMNGCYKSLITLDDKYIVSKFKEMTDECGHSEICLLNIIAQCIFLVYGTIIRDSLNTSSLEKYSESWEKQYRAISVGLSASMSGNLSHECKGIDIKSCNPDEPMFMTK
jgi:hypothetical protein